VVRHTQKEGGLNMAKLTGKKKKEFVARMARARKAAAKRKGNGKKKATKKKASKKKASKRPANCGPRSTGSKKKASKKKTRRCPPCAASARNLPVIRKRMGKHSVKNVTCAIVRVGNSCRRICFSTVGKSHLKSGAINPKAKRFLLSNQPAKGCKRGKRAVPQVVLRGLGF